MALDRRTREEMLAHCGEIHAEDGVDPRHFFQTNPVRHKENRKAAQLCRQVAETLDLVLSGECDDEVLRDLRVVSVVPAPDSSRLLVTLQADFATGKFDSELVVGRLAAASGRLRHAVAAAITRRKAPSLAFNVLGPVQLPLEDKTEGAQ